MWPRVNGLRAMELGTPGASRNGLNALTLSGTKVATAGLLREYELEEEPLETIGERLSLLDSAGEAVGVIEITALEIVPFLAVPWSFARAEGEGFTSIENWRELHREYWQRADNVTVADDTPIVCIHYRLVTDCENPAS